MSSVISQSAKLNRIMLVMISMIVLATGCSENLNQSISESDRTDTVGVQIKNQSVARSATQIQEEASEFQFGNRLFRLDVVICLGRSTATITASDSKDRDDHPVVSAKIYDLSMSGGYSINTFSALFENRDPAEHWILHEGIVEKSGDTIIASGTLKGSLLQPNQDGTRRSVPMEEGGLQSFEARFQC